MLTNPDKYCYVRMSDANKRYHVCRSSVVILSKSFTSKEDAEAVARTINQAFAAGQENVRASLRFLINAREDTDD